MSSRTRKQLEEWIKTKTLGGKILDVGGSQLSIIGRAKIAEGSEISVLDLEVPHQGKKPDIVCDLNEIGIPEVPLFDVAVCLEVSEYWWNPVQALKNITALLKPGGRLLISFHFIYPVHNPVENDYIRYTRNGAIKLLQESGLVIQEVRSRTASDSSFRNFYWSEEMRPAKGYPYLEEVGVLLEALKL